MNQEEEGLQRAGAGLARWILPVLALGFVPSLRAKTQDSTVLKIQEEVEEFGGRRINLLFDGHPSFILLPKGDPPADPRAWIWYAPTFQKQYPNTRHAFLIKHALEAGMAFAGVDVGESYGNPEGTRIYAGFHDAVTARFKLSSKAVLLPQSRGGLMLYNWAALHPDQVQRIAGIYTVCDLRSYPGLKTAAAAYHLTEEKLAGELSSHNPIDLLAPLAKAKVPILHIHGDKDKVVPLEKNSAAVASRYRELGGMMEVIVVPGKGHEEVDEFFTSERFVRFLTTGKAAVDDTYEFLGKLTKIGPLSEGGMPALLIGDADPRWFAEFMLTRAVKGKPPTNEEGVVRFAIHSPALKGLTDKVGKTYRILGRLVSRRGETYHELELEPQ
jgi:hypothetical protein